MDGMGGDKGWSGIESSGKNNNTFTVFVASFTRSGECSTTPLDESLHDGRKARFNKTATLGEEDPMIQ